MWVDGGYGGDTLAVDLRTQYGWTVEVVERPPGTRGFQVVPKRWIVERTLAWLVKQRRLRLDYEATLAAASAFILLAMIGLMTRRLARHDHS